MARDHRGELYVEGNSPVHALAPQAKVVAALVAVFAVVATPRTASGSRFPRGRALVRTCGNRGGGRLCHRP